MMIKFSFNIHPEAEIIFTFGTNSKNEYFQ